jgi:hypothetical protein
MSEAVCPLCNSAAAVDFLGQSAWCYTCPTCGTFELWDFDTTKYGTKERWVQMRVQLSKAARKASEEGKPLRLTDEASLAKAIGASA